MAIRKAPVAAVKAAATEHSEQCALFEICRLHEGRYPALRNLFAVPNAAKRTPAVAHYMISEGLKSGAPDMFLAHPGTLDGTVYPGIFIEMKREGFVPSDVKPSQRDWGDRLMTAGYAWRVCGGWQNAWSLVSAFLNIPAAL